MKKAGKIVIITASFGILLACTLPNIGRTDAYLTDQTVLKNRMTVGYCDTEIKEEFPDPDPVSPERPSDISKTVSVVNHASVDCYIRMAVYPDQSELASAISFVGGDTVGWINGGDGYYYYRYPVKPGTSTTPLFRSIHLSGDGCGSYLTETDTWHVICYEESVQAEKSGIPYQDYAEAWKLERMDPGNEVSGK